MKLLSRCLVGVLVLLIFISNSGFNENDVRADQLRGAWLHQKGNEAQLLLFIDGYTTHTVYSKAPRKFTETSGGTYKITGKKLSVFYEFDTRKNLQTGQSVISEFSLRNNQLTIEANGKTISYKRIDDGSAPLTGVWHITARKQKDTLVPIHRTGTRKTIKILSGTRFQWAAIDPGTKQFFGTGGGTYEFANGKYTEHIEFFSRDNSRVGASLKFDGKLENGEWHHSGLSSRGEKIYETWGRVVQ